MILKTWPRAGTFGRLAAAALTAMATFAQPVAALERLSDSELDSVTAGGVDATALAEAWAQGPRASTASATETFVRKDTLRSYRFRRLSNGLTIAESLGDRAVEYGYAGASAEARGISPTVNCQVKLRFSVPAAINLNEHWTVQRPGSAACQCATFGMSILTD